MNNIKPKGMAKVMSYLGKTSWEAKKAKYGEDGAKAKMEEVIRARWKRPKKPKDE